MIKNYSRFLVIIVAVFLHTTTQAQENKFLSEKVNKAHNAGAHFEAASFFTSISGSGHSVLTHENLLSPNKVAIETFYGKRPEAVTLSFTDKSTGKIYTLEMLRSNPIATDANFGYIENSSRFKTGFTDGVHYQGAITSVDKSIATMSVFADGNVMILFASDEGNFIVGKLTDGSGNYVFYNDRDMISNPEKPCGADDSFFKGRHTAGGRAKTTGGATKHKLQLYWECDYQFYQSQGSNLTTARNYMTGLFNQVQALYANENIAVSLKSLYIWTTNDGYPSASSTDGLLMFKGYWNGRGDGFDGDLAHFITKDGNNNGGLAYIDVINVRSYAYAYSEITGTYNTVPTYSWDVMVLTHETGHNVGSHHTHWCGWMTGPGGTCGSIDNCYVPKDPSTTCSSCAFQTYDDNSSSPVWQGTIMSYCHLKSRGINLANGFGPLPGAVIRNNVDTSTILEPMISATLVPTPICSSDGTVSLTFDATNFGTPPYTYSWSNGSANQNLTGITTPGTYTVQITDANGATNEYSAYVSKYPKPGDALATGYIKPVCCNEGPSTVTLSASVPVDISSCQTVAWLRTTTALNSYAAAQAAFSTATPADILISKNTNSISNSTAALVEVASPAPCIAANYYYTPFVTRKLKAVHNISSRSSTGIAVTQASVNIGTEVDIADETGLVTTCDEVDTASVKTLSITVTGYTGRTGNMTLIVEDAGNDQVIYRQTGLAGNGTYSPAIDTVKNPLKKLKVIVFDFNCSDPNTCTGSTATVSVTRTVVYPAVAQVVLDKACVVGQSVQLGFAPSDCEGVRYPATINNTVVVAASLNVYPNPASKSVTVQFLANTNGTAAIKVTDVLGKVVDVRNASFAKGDNLVQIDVHGWAKGIYTLSFNDGQSMSQNIKLVVQ